MQHWEKYFFVMQFVVSFVLHQNVVRAAEPIPIELEKLVLMTPEVSEVIQKLQLNEANISLLNAEEKPQLKFLTDGNYPISRNISSSSSRVATTSERYIDGKFVFETNIYDFGAQEEKIRAERERRKSLSLDFSSAKQNAVADLFQIANRAAELKKQLGMLVESFKDIERSRATAKARFLQGVGTNLETREVELLYLELETEQSLKIFEYEQLKKQFKVKYQSDFSDLDKYVMPALKNMSELSEQINFVQMGAIKKFDYEIKALRAESNSIETGRYPKITSSLSVNLYDLHKRPGHDYSVSGGIGFSLPIIDGGMRSGQLRSKEVSIRILESQKSKALQKVNLDWAQNLNELERNKTELSELQARQGKIRQKAQQISLLMESLQSNFVDKVKVEFDLQKINRQISEIISDRSRLKIENVRLREAFLLETING